MIRSVLLAFVLAACGDDNALDPDAATTGDGGSASDADVTIDAGPTEAITIPFAAKIDGVPFACGQTFTDVGSARSSIVGVDFRFFVHDVKVVTTSGDVPVSLDVNNFQTTTGIALMDFENGNAAGCTAGTVAMHPAITGTIPTGTVYSGLKFSVGVPFARNHINASLSTSPMNIPAMFWSWSQGYIFLKFDATAGNQGLSIHLGTTGCNTQGTTPPTAPCTNPNTMPIELGNYVAGTSVIVADIGPVVAELDVTFNTTNTSQGCMSFPGDPECNTVLPKLGLPYGAFPAEAQKFLSLQ